MTRAPTQAELRNAREAELCSRILRLVNRHGIRKLTAAVAGDN